MNQHHDAGGVARIDSSRPADRRRAEQERFDRSYESCVRGEHRYSDTHQTASEQEARRQRDALKQRLAGLISRSG